MSEALELVRWTWERQARTEYTAAALTAQLSHWLLQGGASPESLERCARLVGDEVRHARRSHELAVLAGAPAEPLVVDRRRLRHKDDPGAPIELRALGAVCSLAVEESVATVVFGARLRNATEPAARAVVDEILRDEGTHRALAWDLVDELSERLGPEDSRAFVRPRLAWWMRVYLTARVGDDDRRCTADELAWGILDRREHWALMQECVAKDVIRAFQRRGLLEPEADPASVEAELVRDERGGLVPPWLAEGPAAPAG